MTTPTPKLASRMSAAATERVQAELANGQDATNPAFTFSCTNNALLLAIADGILDANGLARQELADRGLDQDGTWVGFDRAREIHFVTPAENTAEPEADTAAEHVVAEIARRLLHLDTLETRNTDALDFAPDLAVWTIRGALVAAYNAGAKTAGSGQATRQEG
jgi:hypothetical protein